MAYLDVITLAEAKDHLRVDETLTGDDSAITRMIESALKFIERYTNIIAYQRSVTYLMVDGEIIVYDYPINDVTLPADYDDDDTTEQHGYSIFEYGSETTNLTLDVGYADAADYPTDLKEVAFEIIDKLYHEPTKDYKKELSMISWDILNSYKRFII